MLNYFFSFRYVFLFIRNIERHGYFNWLSILVLHPALNMIVLINRPTYTVLNSEFTGVTHHAIHEGRGTLVVISIHTVICIRISVHAVLFGHPIVLPISTSPCAPALISNGMDFKDAIEFDSWKGLTNDDHLNHNSDLCNIASEILNTVWLLVRWNIFLHCFTTYSLLHLWEMHVLFTWLIHSYLEGTE